MMQFPNLRRFLVQALDAMGASISLIVAAHAASPISAASNAAPVKALFFADPGTGNGSQPYVTDGTATGTVQLKLGSPVNTVTFDEPAAIIMPGKLALSYQTNDRYLLFKFIDNSGQIDTWRSPPSTGSQTVARLVLKNALFFVRNSDVDGQELYKSNGTSKGTQLVCILNAGCGVDSDNTIAVASFYYNNAAYITFRGRSTSDSNKNIAYKVGQTHLNLGFSFTGGNYGWETQVDGNLLYPDKAKSGLGALWATDGTESGKHIVTTFKGNGIVQRSSLTYRPLYTNGKMLFVADDNRGRQFWVSDGTSANTVPISNFSSTNVADEMLSNILSNNSPSYAGKVYTVVRNSIVGIGDYGFSIFVIDGKSNNVSRLSLNYGGKNLIVVDGSYTVSSNGWIYFSGLQYGSDTTCPSANSSECNNKLYRYNIADMRVEIVADPRAKNENNCANCDYIDNLTAIGSSLLFSASDRTSPTYNFQPWFSSDGTPSTTSKIKNIGSSFNGHAEPNGFLAIKP